MTSVTFTVPGQPRPKERARVTQRGTFTPRRTEDYERAVYTRALQAVCSLPGGRWSWPRDAWYRCEIALHVRDRRLADADNVGKAIADACHDVLWLNDKRVSAPHPTLVEVCSPEPRAVVTVTVVGPPVGWERAPRRRKGGG